MPHFSGRWGECHAFVGAMKIARNVPVSDRHDEWHPPFVGAMKIARNVPVSGRCVEWHPPSVGAMKIARNPGFSGRYVEWHHVGHSTIQPGTCETVGLRAIFIAPTKLRIFHRPKNLPVSTAEAIPGGPGHPRMGTSEKRN